VSRARLHFVRWLACWLGVVALARAVEPPAIIDCHVHLWDIARPAGLGWIKRDNQTLYRSFLPKDHEPIAKANGVTGIIVVQAGQSLPDNQWNLDITAHNKALYRGIVGNLSEVIGTPKFKPLFDRLCKDPRYVGYRLSGRFQQLPTESFFADLRHTAQKGRTVDFLLGSYRLEEVAEIARRVPELRIIVDHLGGVKLDGSPLAAAWVAQFRALAKQPNVHCKVSALFGRWEKQPAPQDLAAYTEALDLAFECYGEDRLIFGSDWPVTEQTADYAAVLRLTRAYFDRKGRAVSEKLFHQNAAAFYRPPPPEGASRTSPSSR
jgi:predicted TIM-barrel fold metal-dependent hydrolase